MKKLIYEKSSRIIRNRKKLERNLDVKISNHGKEITIEGKPEDEYIAEKVFEALEFGFPFSICMMIKDSDYVFEIINIKENTKRKDLKIIRARLIGKKGKTFSTLSTLTKCYFELKDNSVAIVGDPEYIKNAQEAIISLIKGSKQSNIYNRLEKHQVKPVFDLGLKKEYK